MEYKKFFNTEEEKQVIMQENSHLYLIHEAWHFDEKYLLLTDEKPIPSIEMVVQEQGNKISILEAENADILLDSVKKDIKIEMLENDIADIILEMGAN